MNISEKLVTIAENQEKVYKAGQSSMVDESKIIEKTVSGEYISVDDVSEIPHKVDVMLTSGNGKNLWRYSTKFTAKGDGKSHTLLGGTTINGEKFVFSCDVQFEDISYSEAGNFVFMSVHHEDETVEYLPIAQSYNTTSRRISFFMDGRVSPISKILISQHYRFTSGTVTLTNIMLEEGNITRGYEPRKQKLTNYSGVTVFVGISENEITQTITANPDGTVEGIISQSPCMYITTDNPNVTINATYYKSYGMQTEYDRFWDVFQENGNRTDYSTAFRYQYWNDTNFKPKHLIQPTNADNMFQRTAITDIRMVDLTKVTSLGSLCNSSTQGIRYVGQVGNASLTTFGSVFGWCHKLISVEKMIVGANAQFGNAFTGCYDLESIAFEGTIGYSISFAESSKLNRASIISIFNALSTTITERTLTLSTTAIINAFGSTDYFEWAELVASKPNWTITLA